MLNKKLVALAAATIIGTSLFVGCGAKEEPKKETTATEQGFTGTKTGEIKGEEDTTVAEVTFENGTPVSVNIDVLDAEGGKKSELSASGNYKMTEDGMLWHEQIDALEEAIKDNNFDLSKINLTDEEGHTDAVSGVSIKVGSYIEAVQNALDQAK